LKLDKKLLRDVMTRGVVTAPMDATVKEVATLLSKQGVSAVTIISPDGEAVGIISEMDLLKVIGKENWENMPAESIMSSRIESVKPTSTLGEAAKIMMKKHIHRLLVLSERGVGASQRPVGILSASDIVRVLAKGC